MLFYSNDNMETFWLETIMLCGFYENDPVAAICIMDGNVRPPVCTLLSEDSIR